jgi:hypothetical protein
MQQLDSVIEDNALYYLEDWSSDDANVLLRRLELCGKLKAVPDFAAWIDEDIIWTVDQLQSCDFHVDCARCDACPVQPF